MADVRALLKAKRQEVRITHPYAAYGANGALRCTACGTAIKFASAWEGHLGSKAHRVAVSKRKAEEEREDEDGDGEEDQMATATRKKRQRTEESEIAPGIDGPSSDAPHSTGTGFPADFFSDPSRAPPRTSTGGQDDDDDDDADDDGHNQDAKAKTAAAPAPPAPKSQFDMEWDAFERDMQQQRSSRPAGGNESAALAAAAAAAMDPQEMYARATIAAEPELVSRMEGLPVDSGATAQEGTTEQGGTLGAVEEGGRKVPEEELERRRKERDERELIMDRLVEEERAQEDAYGRVALLKNRIQMLKEKRELAKAKGKTVAAAGMET